MVWLYLFPVSLGLRLSRWALLVYRGGQHRTVIPCRDLLFSTFLLQFCSPQWPLRPCNMGF